MGLLIKKPIEPNFDKSISASFNNVMQKSLEQISKEQRDAFINASTPASDEDIRTKIYDDQEAYLSENIIGE